jgi:hypothetical protein
LCGGLLSLTGGNITTVAGRTFLIFGDIEEKLDVLRVECTKCTRKGCYRLSRLIEKYRRKGNMIRTAIPAVMDCWRGLFSSAKAHFSGLRPSLHHRPIRLSDTGRFGQVRPGLALRQYTRAAAAAQSATASTLLPSAPTLSFT